MFFSIKISFIEKEGVKKYQRSTNFYFSNTFDLVAEMKIFLQKLPQYLNKIKSRKFFYEINEICFYVDHIKVLTIDPKRNSTELMTIDYLLIFSEFKLTNIDAAKIIKHHFSFFYFPLDIMFKNRIDNIIQNNQIILLSNQFKLSDFPIPKRNIDIHFDNLEIKKRNFFTKVNYRGYK
jgi:hypothetical protein